MVLAPQIQMILTTQIHCELSGAGGGLSNFASFISVPACSVTPRGYNRQRETALDLNWAAEVADIVLDLSYRVESPLLPTSSLPGVFSNAVTNTSRVFGLSSRPGLDDTGMAPNLHQGTLPAKSTSSIQFLSSYSVRMNNAGMSSILPWFCLCQPLWSSTYTIVFDF